MYATQFFSTLRRICWTSFCLFCALIFASEIHAQQPTATIIKIKGTVSVSLQGKPPMAATVGAILQAGDVIETQAVSSVGLRFSDGSELRLGQKSKVDLAALTQVPATKARESRLKLWYGSLRAWIAPEHQTTGSSFEVDTPNALAGVKFSQPVIEVSYDPSTKTSLFKAYTVALIVRNAITGESKQIPQGLQVVVRNESTVTMPLPPEQIPSPQDDIPETPQTKPLGETSVEPPAEPLIESPAEIPKAVPEAPKVIPAVPAAPTNPSPPVQETLSNTTPSTTQTRESPAKSTNISEQARYIARGAASSSVPISVGVVGTSDTSASATSGESGATTTETSTNPSPGTRPESAEQRVSRPIIIRIEQE